MVSGARRITIDVAGARPSPTTTFQVKSMTRHSKGLLTMRLGHVDIDSPGHVSVTTYLYKTQPSRVATLPPTTSQMDQQKEDLWVEPVTR